jgi:hypothetical protein
MMRTEISFSWSPPWFPKMVEKLSSPFDHVFSLFDVNSSDIIELSRHAQVDPSFSFADADLRDVDLSNKNLEGFDFAHANLTGCSFAGASVFLTDFSFAILDLDALGSASHFECAIWPNDIFANLKHESPKWQIQRTLRLAKSIHDSFSGPRALVGLPVQLGGQEIEDPIYDLAVILDTIGGKLPPALYTYAAYLLSRPLDYRSGEEDLSAPREKPPSFVDEALWLNENRITAEIAYGVEAVNPGFFDLGSFFWREKLKARQYNIQYHLVHGRFKSARTELTLLRTEARLRGDPWLMAVADIEPAIVDVVEDSQEARLAPLLLDLKRRLSDRLLQEAVGIIVWDLYLAAIHLESAPLRSILDRIMENYGDIFWGEYTEIDKRAIEVLSTCPGFWELKRAEEEEDPGDTAPAPAAVSLSSDSG